MAMRLVLDDGSTPYIIDEAKTGSASTTTGVRLLGPKEGPFEWVVNEGRDAEISCRVRVTAATTAALVTAVDALLAVLNSTRGRSVEVRYDSTNVMFQLPLASWTTFTATTGVRYLVDPRGGGGAEIDILFSAQKLSAANQFVDTTDPLKGGNWQYVRKGTGLAIATAEGVFGTLASAVAWANKLRDKTGFPNEVSDDFEVIEENFGFTNAGASPLGDSDVAARVLLQQKPSWIAADARLDPFKVVECQSAVRDVQRNIADAPDNVVTKIMGISGALILKTEKSTDFDTADTSVTAAGAISALVKSAIDAVIEGLEERTSEDMREMGRSISYNEDGQITFSVELVLASANIIQWDEEIELVIDSQTDIIRDYTGEARVYRRPGGVAGRITHTLRAETFKQLRYRSPQLSGDQWEFTSGRFPRGRQLKGPNQETPTWHIGGTTTWEWKPDGSTEIESPEPGRPYEPRDIESAL